MSGLNDSFILDDEMEPQVPKVVINALANTAPGEEPLLKDNVDLIAAVECTREVDKFRDLELLSERIINEKGMSVSIAQESIGVLTDFVNEERPLAYFTQAPTRTNLKAALEAIEAEKKGILKSIGGKIKVAFLEATEKIDKVLKIIFLRSEAIEKLTPRAKAIAKKIVTKDAKLYQESLTWNASAENSADLEKAKRATEKAIRDNMSSYHKAFYAKLLEGDKGVLTHYLKASSSEAIALFSKASDIFSKVTVALKADGLHTTRLDTSEIEDFIEDFKLLEKEIASTDPDYFDQNDASTLLKQISEGTSFYAKVHTRYQIENVASIITDNLDALDPKDEDTLKDVYLQNVETLRSLAHITRAYAVLCDNHLYLIRLIIKTDEDSIEFWKDVFEDTISTTKDITKATIAFIRRAISKQ